MPENRRVQEAPIRIKPRSKAKAVRIAAATGVNHIQVVEWALDALADHFDHHGGRLLLPLRFHETFSVTTLTAKPPPTILMEPPRQPKLDVRAGAGKKNRGSRLRV